MAAGLYREGRSFLHTLDASAKLIALVCWFGTALSLQTSGALAALAVLVIVGFASCRLLGVLIRFGRFMVILFVMCALLWALFSRDAGGLREGAFIGLRLTTMLAMGLLFLAGTRVEEMALGLQRLGLPFMAAFSLTLAFRLLPLFAGTASTIAQAQACRGLSLKEGGLLTRIRRHVPLLVPLVLSCLRTSDRLAIALEARGLGMGRHRTSMIESRFGVPELGVVLLSSAVLVVSILLRAVGFSL